MKIRRRYRDDIRGFERGSRSRRERIEADWWPIARHRRAGDR